MDKRIGVLVIASRQDPGHGSLEPDAAGYVRLLLPLQYPTLADHVQVRVVAPEDVANFEADALVFNRSVLPSALMVDDIARHCRETETRLVYDLDDALLSLSPSHVDYEHYRSLRPAIIRSVEVADQVFVSSEPLKRQVQPHNASVEVIPNVLDERLFCPPAPPRRDGVVRFVFMGTITHGDDLALIQPAIQKAHKAFGKRVSFSLIGGVPRHMTPRRWVPIAIPPAALRSYPSFTTWLSVQNAWHVGLAPLLDTEFNRAKSYLKYLDYAVLGLPGIFSDVEPFRPVVRHGANGLLCDASPEAWYDAIATMVENVALREAVAQAARQDFLAHHSLAACSAGALARWQRLVPQPRGIRRRPAQWPGRDADTPEPPPVPINREAVADRYLAGSGIEIGALQNPLRLSARARVKYVDRMSNEDLWTHYPELKGQRLVPVDIIDDGERLLTFPDGGLDFIVANHFLEHCEDPIQTLESFARVLRPGGVTYLAIPDKRYTFDKHRTPTPLEHLIRDHEEGPVRSRHGHFEEWVRFVQPEAQQQPVTETEVRRRVEDLERMNYSIHFHAWRPEDFREFLEYIAAHLPLRIELFASAGMEMLVVLRREDDRPAPAASLSGQGDAAAPV